MKKVVFTILIIITIVINTFAQNTADLIDKKISSHFLQYKPELHKYAGLASYGDTKTNFDHAQIAKERSLFDEVAVAQLWNFAPSCSRCELRL